MIHSSHSTVRCRGTALLIPVPRGAFWSGGQRGAVISVSRKSFFFKKTRLLVSSEYWLKYKRISAKLHQVVRDSKRRFWDAVCSKAVILISCIKVFGKLRIGRAPLRTPIFFLQCADLLGSDAEIQADYLPITLVRIANMSQSFSRMGVKIAPHSTVLSR